MNTGWLRYFAARPSRLYATGVSLIAAVVWWDWGTSAALWVVGVALIMAALCKYAGEDR